ncbi:MAG: hypothetical protein ACLR7U_05080 [Ruthenibacterium lactatiformans]
MVENLPEIPSAATLLGDSIMELREDAVVPSYPRDEMLPCPRRCGLHRRAEDRKVRRAYNGTV